MTTATRSNTQSNGIGALRFSRRIVERYLSDFPEDRMTFQPNPGANHVLWNVGHIAYADDAFMQGVGGLDSKLPEAWKALFGMGSDPVDDASQYPSFSEVKAVFDERRDALIKWFEGMSDEQLAQPLPEDFQGFADNFGMLMSNLASHESIHAGQIGAVRKAIGLERVMG